MDDRLCHLLLLENVLPLVNLKLFFLLDLYAKLYSYYSAEVSM